MDQSVITRSFTPKPDVVRLAEWAYRYALVPLEAKVGTRHDSKEDSTDEIPSHD